MTRIPEIDHLWPNTAEGIKSALAALKVAQQTALEGETFDLYFNGRHYIIRCFDDGIHYANL